MVRSRDESPDGSTDERPDDRHDERGAIATSASPWSAGPLLLLAGITAVAAVLRLFHLEIWSLGETEATTWRAATMPPTGPHGFYQSEQGAYPLAYLLLRQALQSGLLPGSGEGWLRLPFAFVGTLTVPLFALAIGRHAGRTVALLAALLLALHPWHVFLSQSADPRGVALLLAIAALLVVRRAAAEARRRDWVLTSLGLLASGLSHPLGWCFALGGLLLVSLRRWRSALRNERLLRVGGGVLLLVVLLRTAADEAAADGAAPSFGSLLLAGVHALGVPVLLFAIAGLVLVRPQSRALVVVVLLPIVLAPLAVWCGGPPAADVAAAALLPLLLAAAMFVRETFVRLRQAHAAVAAAPVLAWLPGAVVVTALAVDSFLYTTAEHGWRAPWRQAANAVLANIRAPSAGGVAAGVVAAGIGTDSLYYYLLPNHWRAAARDAHENVRLVPLPHGEVAAAMANLSPEVGFVVLREEERAQVDASPAARQRLAAEFEMLRVLPCPQPFGDETVTVYGRAAGR